MVYILEDDASIRELLSYSLEKSGVHSKSFSLPSEFNRALVSEKPELILLDIMLPEEDGLSVLARLRETPETSIIPVIMLTAKSSEFDKVTALNAGADDYMVKPFDFRELIAVIHVMARKSGDNHSNIYKLADLTLDIAAKQVTRGGKVIDLTAKEYALLEFMMRNKGMVLSREQIENNLWNYKYEGGSNVVNVYIGYLRKKIDEGFDKKLIHTVWGIGWVLRED